MKSLMKQKIFNRVKFKKYIFIFLALIFIFNITPVLAIEGFDTQCSKGDVCYETEIDIPGFPEDEFKVKSNTLGLYIKVIYEYLLYVAGVLAVIVIMVGGFQWITAGGNQSKIGEAKERVMGAIIGLFLALGSYLLLYTINPDLVKIADLNMPSIEPIGGYCPGEAIVTEIDANSRESLGNASIGGAVARCGHFYNYKTEEGTSGEQKHECRGESCVEEGADFICFNDECTDDNVLYDMPCDNNNDSFCPPHFICKSGLVRPDDSGYGLCARLMGLNSTCEEDPDCLDGFSCVDAGAGAMRCKHVTSSLCENKNVGDSCSLNALQGYCNDELACIQCAALDTRCGFGFSIPQYACPNPDGICGTGVGDYCSDWGQECTEDLN